MTLMKNNYRLHINKVLGQIITFLNNKNIINKKDFLRNSNHVIYTKYTLCVCHEPGWFC